ncbi:MAG: tRNA (N6-isopentenyl adenosine(37)-C2)-methylthiotransferase MiaB [Firmicutes bacterium]|nr:tRNA (N6-isopentenyl adenosine(37)-C2)-methylthiotransferase MiaB [Bacillota bacterium]
MSSNNIEQRKFYLKTMGCQMNAHDSEVITGILLSLGYQETDSVEDAELILYNTCSVRENPERKVYGQISRFKALKEQKPGLIIGICGCMTQQKDEQEAILKKLPHVDLIFGTHNIHRLPELLERALDGERVIEVWEDTDEIVEDLPVRRSNNLKAFVNIIYGCTNFCSYCIVPYTRGKEISRQPEAIINEVTSLAQEGFKEVTLLGQNVNSYGKDLGLNMDFADLLKQLNDIPGLERIRFTTSHPKDMKDSLIDALANLPKVCEHLHLPVQSGSNRILKLMNRGYTREYYLDLVRKIKEAVPNISLTTDLIVGFPGETEEDFQDTLDLIREVGFSSSFTFIFSPRNGTPAATMSEQIPEEVKKDRIYRLIELQNEISSEYMQTHLNQVVEVLVDGVNSETQELTGRTRTNHPVTFIGDPNLVSKLVPVKITQCQTWSLRGELVK